MKEFQQIPLCIHHSWSCIAALLLFTCAPYLRYSLSSFLSIPYPARFSFSLSLPLSLSLSSHSLYSPSLSSLLYYNNIYQFLTISIYRIFLSLSLSDFYLFLTLSIGLRQHSTVSLIRSCDGSPVTLFRACFSFSYADSKAIILWFKTNSSPCTLWNL